MTNGEKFREIFKNVPCGISNDKKFINAWYTEDGYCIIPIEWWNAEYKEPTTKNDLAVDCIPNTISLKEIMDDLKITAEDIENAEDLEYSIEPLIFPKNDLAVDLISREDVLKLMQDNWHTHNGDWAMQESMDDIRALPSVTPQLSSELEKNSKKLEKDFGESDCISRADVERAIEDVLQSDDCDYDLREFLADLVDIPSVTPIRSKGHWISMNIGKQSHIKDGMTIESVFCSECGGWLTASDEYACYGRYCPNCGAKMESEG